MDDVIKFIQFLVSLGLSPLEIFTCIVAVVLYRKSEQLDNLLHDCLGVPRGAPIPKPAKDS